jgi:putative ABC transport system permease protein
MTMLILLIAVVGIVNTILLSSLERTKEIGMMKALGLREREIIFTFMIEAAGIGLIGGLIGCLLGGGVNIYLTSQGVDLTTMVGGLGDWGLPIMGKLYGVWNFPSYIFVVVFGVISSLAASYLPARWAARKDPVDAMYGNYQ